MTNNRTIRVLLTGCSFSGNLGGSAMYDSVIDELRGSLPELEISVLSKYPEDDQKGCRQRGYTLIPYPTTKQLMAGGAFYLFGGLLKFLHLPYRWLAAGPLKAYFENDILVDASGTVSYTHLTLPTKA